MLYGQLQIGDVFEIAGQQRFRVIPLIKGGSCGCVPQWNAQDFTDSEIFGFFHMEYIVTKIELFRTHEENYNNLKIELLEYITIKDSTLPVYSDKEYVKPLVSHRYIELDETDVWLMHFGLAERIYRPYYEQFIGNQWIPQS